MRFEGYVAPQSLSAIELHKDAPLGTFYHRFERGMTGSFTDVRIWNRKTRVVTACFFKTDFGQNRGRVWRQVRRRLSGFVTEINVCLDWDVDGVKIFWKNLYPGKRVAAP